jgi:hypothetical protein
MAPQERQLPGTRTTATKEATVDTKSLAHPAHPVVPEETRERGACSACSTTTKTLTAPRPNVGHGYRGPMYCLSCNPRFFAVDMHFSCLERMDA